MLLETINFVKIYKKNVQHITHYVLI